jgi:altronate dehydratase
MNPRNTELVHLLMSILSMFAKNYARSESILGGYARVINLAKNIFTGLHCDKINPVPKYTTEEGNNDGNKRVVWQETFDVCAYIFVLNK